MGNSPSKELESTKLKTYLANYLKTGDRSQLQLDNLNQIVDSIKSKDAIFLILSNTTNRNNMTAIQLAALKGHTDVLKALLKLLTPSQCAKLISSRNRVFNSFNFALGDVFIEALSTCKQILSLENILALHRRIADYEDKCTEVVKCLISCLQEKAGDILAMQDGEGLTVVQYLVAMGYAETIYFIRNSLTAESWMDVLGRGNTIHTLVAISSDPLNFTRNVEHLPLEQLVELICKAKETGKHKPVEVMMSLLNNLTREQQRILLGLENIEDRAAMCFFFLFGYMVSFEDSNFEYSNWSVTNRIQVAFSHATTERYQFLQTIFSDEEIFAVLYKMMLSNKLAPILSWSVALEDLEAIILLRNSVCSLEEWIDLLKMSDTERSTPLQLAASCESSNVVAEMVKPLTAEQVFKLILSLNNRGTSTMTLSKWMIDVATELAPNFLESSQSRSQHTVSSNESKPTDILSDETKSLLAHISNVLSKGKMTEVLCVQDIDGNNTLLHLAPETVSWSQ